jgi:hypothetical protein
MTPAVLSSSAQGLNTNSRGHGHNDPPSPPPPQGTCGGGGPPQAATCTTVQVATINPPDSTSFDVGYYSNGIYYLADRTTKGIDVINAANNAFLGTITGFVGPNGVLVIPQLHQLWAGDSDSTVKVVDLTNDKIIATIATGGSARADELAYDPQQNVIVVANDNDVPPFLTFISVSSLSVVGHLSYPQATGGLEQSVWNPQNGMFYLNVPSTTANPGGEVDEINPVSMKIVNVYPLSDCNPSGLAIGPQDHFLIGCSSTSITATSHARTLVMDAHNGHVIATIMQVGGEDEVAYDSANGMYYVAANHMTTTGYSTGSPTPVLGVINARTNQWVENLPTGNSAHSVAVDPENNHIFVPVSGGGIFVFATVKVHPSNKFFAELKAAPGVTTGATGLAVFQLSPDGSTLSYTLSVSNIQNVFMAHIHLAPSADILTWLYPNPNTVASGGEAACIAVLSGGPVSSCPGYIAATFTGVLVQGTITAADLSGSTTCDGCSGLASPTLANLILDMEAGVTFVNVHTSQNPGGEIQGTIQSGPIAPPPPPPSPPHRHFHFESSLVGSAPGVSIDGIASGGAPWIVASGHAGVAPNGMLNLNVAGLLITGTGTSNDGTTGPVTQVLASLICQTSSGISVTSSNAVPLDSNGNAHISQQINVPSTCFAPIILVRIAATTSGAVSNGPWIASTGF